MSRFIGNVDPSNDKDFQALYASQLYGTFFSVFGKFTCEEIAEKEYTLKKIEFKLINYKGLLNLGITDVKGFFEEGKEPLINIEVQALGGQTCYEYGCPGIKVKKDQLLLIERTLRRMHNNRGLYGDVFDEEFYFREGLPDVPGEYLDRPLPRSSDDASKARIEYPGTKCPRAANLIR
ncbi:MAG: hypothetical protein RIF33_20215 [Cyclobacteriaceae bacterium]